MIRICCLYLRSFAWLVKIDTYIEINFIFNRLEKRTFSICLCIPCCIHFNYSDFCKSISKFRFFLVGGHSVITEDHCPRQQISYSFEVGLFSFIWVRVVTMVLIHLLYFFNSYFNRTKKLPTFLKFVDFIFSIKEDTFYLLSCHVVGYSMVEVSSQKYQTVQGVQAM